ncbi:MAG: hypothetical protein OXH78_08575 [Acidimicrobiaceae bacterium]|nr:hypothetical protein [Acidimicrobiaceae bacterium]
MTDDIAGANARATAMLGKEEQAASYKNMLDREGLSSAGEICIVGNEDRVSQQLAAFFAAGATTVLAAPIGTDDEIERTWELLALLSSSAK